MFRETEFLFLQRVLQNLHLPVHILTAHTRQEAPLDMGLRHFLGQDEAYEHLFFVLPAQLTDNTIYKVSDSLLCSYLFLRLPHSGEMLVIGPYMQVQMSREQLLQEAERFAIPPGRFRQLEAFSAAFR